MATLIRPHTASLREPKTPTRPQSSYSTRSTIRRVTPSPDSLTDALDRGFAAHSMPKQKLQGNEDFMWDNEMSRPWTSAGIPESYPPSPTPAASATTLRHSRVSAFARTARRLSTRKRTQASPHKHHHAHHSSTKRPRPFSTPKSLFSHKEADSPTMTQPDRPATASPTSPEQREQYSPLTRPSTGTSSSYKTSHFREEFGGQDTIKPSPSEFNYSTPPRNVRSFDDPDAVTPAPLPQFNYLTPTYKAPIPDDDPDAITPASLPQFSYTTPHSNLFILGGQSCFGGAMNRGSPPSRDTVFSTPGRDEMERKRVAGSFQGDGPFTNAKGMKDLQAQRRQISGDWRVEGKEKEESKDGARKKGQECCCCLAM